MSFLALNNYLVDLTQFKETGRFEDVPFYVLVKRINGNKLSGKLVVSKGDRIKHIYFDRGNPVSVKSNLTAESLDSIIIRMGFLTQEKMLQALKDIEKTNFLENLDFEQKLFLYLKEREFLSPDDLNLALKQQFSERLLNLFGWFSGDYSFEQESNLVYNLSSQVTPLNEIFLEIENLLYPKRSEKTKNEIGNIHGNFKDTFFPTLATILIANRVTGKLIMQKKDRSKELRIHEGIPVSINSDHKMESLSQIILRLGMLDSEKIKELKEESKYLGSDIESLLKEKQLLSANDTKLTKALLYTERFLEVFSWRSGLYRFEKRKPVSCPHCKIQIQIKVDLNYKAYSCPNCNKKLSKDYEKNPELSLVTEKTSQKTVPTTDIKRVYGKISKTSLKAKKEILNGESFEDYLCPDCGKPVDPVIKKCINCADETLLDAYQMDKLKKPESDLSKHPFEKTKEKTDHRTEFDILVNNIIALSLEKRLKSMIISGVSKGVGKSFVALNCAIYIAKNYKRRTLLIDASFSSPGLSIPLEVKPEYGFKEVLKKDIEPIDAVFETAYDYLYLLPLKRKVKKLEHLADKGSIADVLSNLKSKFDFLIVDTNGAPSHSLEREIYELCDGILLIAEKGKTTQKEINTFLEKIPFKNKIIGTVLNRID